MSTLPRNHRMISDADVSCDIETTGSFSNTKLPLVSVVIPSYNSGNYLAEAVSSVFGQTYPAVECVVIDDGSTDHTGQVLEELLNKHPALKAARQTNGGPSSARNMGTRLCSGSLISFLDADDVLLPDKIARQVAFLQAHSDVGFVYSDYLVTTKDLHPRALFIAEMPAGLDSLDAFCYRNWFNSLVALIRRSVIERVGGFDESLAVAEDWDYWIRCAEVTRLSYVAGPVALYRQHRGQLHRDHVRMREACLRVAAKNFRDHRTRLRAAMAAIELNHAKYLWKHDAAAASCAALIKCAIDYRLGLHRGQLLRQLAAFVQPQLKHLTRRGLSGVLDH